MNSVPSFPAHLATPRLWLRRLQMGDAKAIHAYRSLPEVARYQGWETFELADAVELIESQFGAEPGVAGTWFQLAIVDKGGGTLIGDCGLHCLEDGRQMEFGITLAPSHQGKGYATEALRCLLDYVFGVLAMHRVSAVMGADNHAVAALFRRLGFRQEGHHVEHRWYKGYWDSEFVFALLRREWAASLAAGDGAADRLPKRGTKCNSGHTPDCAMMGDLSESLAAE
ncbi:MAG TPA: GNAT family protein [Prosthecobacter sp.]|nr:GNAT family protein [Prosthecobacter sp.]